ncbi:MAG: glycosyltransferase [Candidatus Stygibacter frigidus]|nr:glycosyltransferase [Candidatus Stygibacter frigidus]
MAGRERVSVVISARNEASNIRELLMRLGNQNYPENLYEVIIADDGSVDSTGDMVRKYAENWSNLKVIEIDRESAQFAGKKNALQPAVEAATGEIILITDADCRPGSNWILSMVSCFESDIDMVAGLSRTNTNENLKYGSVNWYEYFDFMAMYAVAGGLILSGKYFSCSAQNLAFRKSSWEKVGGYQQIMHLVSGDDVNLMQLFRKANMKITFNRSSGSFMTTSSVDTWGELLNQRMRWASNTGIQINLNPEFFVYLISVLMITFLPWIVLILNLQIGIWLLAIRLIVEMSFVKAVFKRFKVDNRLWLSYPLWLIIQPIYMLIVTVGGIFSLYRWK